MDRLPSHVVTETRDYAVSAPSDESAIAYFEAYGDALPNIRVALTVAPFCIPMPLEDAVRIVSAPFAEANAFVDAEERILSLATPNQRAIFDALPNIHKTKFLVGLVAFHNQQKAGV